MLWGIHWKQRLSMNMFLKRCWCLETPLLYLFTYFSYFLHMQHIRFHVWRQTVKCQAKEGFLILAHNSGKLLQRRLMGAYVQFNHCPCKDSVAHFQLTDCWLRLFLIHSAMSMWHPSAIRHDNKCHCREGIGIRWVGAGWLLAISMVDVLIFVISKKFFIHEWNDDIRLHYMVWTMPILNKTISKNNRKETVLS